MAFFYEWINLGLNVYELMEKVPTGTPWFGQEIDGHADDLIQLLEGLKADGYSIEELIKEANKRI